MYLRLALKARELSGILAVTRACSFSSLALCPIDTSSSLLFFPRKVSQNVQPPLPLLLWFLSQLPPSRRQLLPLLCCHCCGPSVCGSAPSSTAKLVSCATQHGTYSDVTVAVALHPSPLLLHCLWLSFRISSSAQCTSRSGQE